MTRDILNNPNIKGFLAMLKFSEGVAPEQDAYRTLFGWTPQNNKLFDNGFVDHPREKFPFYVKGVEDFSDAAGAYQLMSYTFDDLLAKVKIENLTLPQLAKSLNIPIFHPTMQDLYACVLISRANGLNYVCNGYIEDAIKQCNGTWASLTGAKYGQPTKALSVLLPIYTGNGGKLNELG